MPLLVLTLFLVGCPKRPAAPVASAPAPTGSALAPAPGAGPSTATPPAPGSSSGPTAMAPSPAAPATAAPAPGTPPRPSEFSENSNLKDVFFDFDKYDIRADDAKTLDSNAGWLKSNANNLVLIEGHCDERGTNEYNLALGERRAKATMNYLVSQGIQANRITIISYGKERPVCNEKSEGCWQKNRRAHFLVKAR
ncbi:MAG TPA: peptidoglycan-associated lipoprotein Pal [Candidatus Nitrosocosmicus sp.]|nr:peptidoglycan-associated lipoprotein Pal [Candidatus Nitrosocosmicus sp.]